MFFFRKFITLLRLEEKAHHFLPIGIHQKISDLYKVQLFLILKFFVLVLIEHSKNKMIGCFGVQQTHTLHEFHTRRTELRNSWWLMPGAFGSFAVLVFIEH